ncbi:MSP domain-containing protein [Mycena venus]|uniref:MSP domain-containing protein n=1 Tax=Mycena venus TaxID=2733690 RepID=A0A8H6YQ20_9AGAR|nr:MSP domain-containing protein [Mycena venus]
MSVSLAPSSALGFNRPLTTLVKRSLTITNHNAQPVAFKVKTTAPKLYCVRPNSGRVEPGQSIDVSVMLQPLKDEPPLNAKCKDKFLIQSTLITPGKEAMPLQDIWSSPDTGEEGKVHQQKLRVVYLPAEGQTLVEEDEEAQTNMSSMMIAPRRLATFRYAPNPAASAPRPPTPPADFSNAHEEPHEEIHPSFDAPGVVITPPEASLPDHEAEPAPTPAPAPVPVPVPVPAAVSAPAPAPPIARTPSVPTPVSLPSPLPPTDDYAAKYNEAHAEIERLRKLLAESQPPAELRRRTRKLSDATAVDVAVLEEAAIQEGVPLQVVVIIALGVFITTYLFF